MMGRARIALVVGITGLLALISNAFDVTAAPAPGGTLTISYPGEADKLDPPFAVSTDNIPILYQVFDTLFRYDPKFTLHPHLVASYQQLDPTMYRLRLRSGVQFTDGREMTSDDVRFSLLRAKDPRVVRRFADNIADVRIVDRYTFEITLEKPDPLLPHWLSTLPTAIVPKDEVEKAGDSFAQHPIGSGPFKLAEWVRGDHVTLEANTNYFLGRPLLDDVVFRTIPDRTTMLLELETGRIDVAYEVSPEAYGRVAANKDLMLEGVPTLELYFLGFNVGGKQQGFKRDSPFNDKRMRLAVYHAVRWDDVFRGAIPSPRFGVRVYCLASVLSAVTTPGCKNDWPQPAYDPAEARRLVQQAGYGQGFTTGIVYDTATSATKGRAAAVIQAELKQGGINASLMNLELPAENDRLLSGDFDMVMLRWGGVGMVDPFGWTYRMFHSSQVGGFRGNLVRYVNPEVDRMLDQAAVAAGQERIRRFRQAQTRIIPDVPLIPIYGTNIVMAWNKRVKGFHPDPLRDWAGGFYRLWVPTQGVRVYLEK
jgi:peptide/nickel transport system substrate-binding protein